jgi:hypothetical protein
VSIEVYLFEVFEFVDDAEFEFEIVWHVGSSSFCYKMLVEVGVS